MTIIFDCFLDYKNRLRLEFVLGVVAAAATSTTLESSSPWKLLPNATYEKTKPILLFRVAFLIKRSYSHFIVTNKYFR
jgi:hypothetical protein